MKQSLPSALCFSRPKCGFCLPLLMCFVFQAQTTRLPIFLHKSRQAYSRMKLEKRAKRFLPVFNNQDVHVRACRFDRIFPIDQLNDAKLIPISILSYTFLLILSVWLSIWSRTLVCELNLSLDALSLSFSLCMS